MAKNRTAINSGKLLAIETESAEIEEYNIS
jgi:hypothetical protein